MPAANREALRPALFACQMVTGWAFPNAVLQHALAELDTLSIDVARIQRRRDRLVTALRGFGYTVHEPQGTFYLLPRCPIADDWAFAHRLAERDVLCMPGQVAELPGYFRLSLTASDDMVERALPALEAAIVATATAIPRNRRARPRRAPRPTGWRSGCSHRRAGPGGDTLRRRSCGRRAGIPLPGRGPLASTSATRSLRTATPQPSGQSVLATAHSLTAVQALAPLTYSLNRRWTSSSDGATQPPTSNARRPRNQATSTPGSRRQRNTARADRGAPRTVEVGGCRHPTFADRAALVPAAAETFHTNQSKRLPSGRRCAPPSDLAALQIESSFDGGRTFSLLMEGKYHKQ